MRIAAHPPPGRLKELYKLRCWVFGQPYNPERQRIGTNVLREPLKGDLLKNYYYPSLKLIPTPKHLNRKLDGLSCFDPAEFQRLQRVEHLKRKGKGAPKKLKEKREVDPKKRR